MEYVAARAVHMPCVLQCRVRMAVRVAVRMAMHKQCSCTQRLHEAAVQRHQPRRLEAEQLAHVKQRPYAQ